MRRIAGAPNPRETAPRPIGGSARVADAVLRLGILFLAAGAVAVLAVAGGTARLPGMQLEGRDLQPLLLLLLLLVAFRTSFAWRALAQRSSASAAILLFSLTLLLYLANGRTLDAGDTRPARYLPLSILREEDFDLDEFQALRSPETPYYLTVARGHHVSAYPVGAALLALPFYVPAALAGAAPDAGFLARLEKLSAATIVGLSAVLLYLTLLRLTSPRMALFVAVVYAAGTSSLSASSQALWQHGPGQLGLAAALYCLVRGRSESRWIAVAGFPLAFSVISRPTNLVAALFLALYVLRVHPRQVPGLLLCALPPILFQLAYNAAVFDDPLHMQWPALAKGLWSTPLGEGLAGVLFSPGRGLFVYSPIFLLSVVGSAMTWRRNGDPLLRLLGPAALVTVLLHAKWYFWWGGHCYGPRLLADLTPLLALSLVPLERLLARSRALLALAMVLSSWSVFAHAAGAFWSDPRWNVYVDVDRNPASLWSWSDNQLVNRPRSTLTRMLVSLRGLPTSRTAPERLAASYSASLPQAFVARPDGMLSLSLTATNDGGAVWLGGDGDEQGTVELAWRWLAGAQGETPGRDPHAGGGSSGGQPLRHAVFPGQSYEFRARVDVPAEPGSYALELGLASKGVASFAEADTPTLRFTVHVAAR